MQIIGLGNIEIPQYSTIHWRNYELINNHATSQALPSEIISDMPGTKPKIKESFTLKKSL